MSNYVSIMPLIFFIVALGLIQLSFYLVNHKPKRHRIKVLARGPRQARANARHRTLG